MWRFNANFAFISLFLKWNVGVYVRLNFSREIFWRMEAWVRTKIATMGVVALTMMIGAHAAEVPAELAPFVTNGALLIMHEAADLNGDGTQDYVLVLEHNDDEGNRSLLIVTRGKDGKLTLAKRNDKIVACRACGGMMGDPFERAEVVANGFTITNSGGSRDRWSNTYEFKYSRRDKTWQLVRARELSYDAPDPDGTTENPEYRPPKDFGKIDIAAFDPYKYRGVYLK